MTYKKNQTYVVDVSLNLTKDQFLLLRAKCEAIKCSEEVYIKMLLEHKILESKFGRFNPVYTTENFNAY